jgi:hypothetical protein
MKLTFSFAISFFFILGAASAQSEEGWTIPMQEIIFKNHQGEPTRMRIDPGLRYADIIYQDKSYRLFYHKNAVDFNRARIFNNETQEEIGRGKGAFLGLDRFIFENGEVIKLKRKRSPNGYVIIGPYGVLFEVQNHGIKPIKTFEETDFLVQAFFIFDRIKKTRKPPSEIMIYDNTIQNNTLNQH